jgi:hypothetical protein
MNDLAGCTFATLDMPDDPFIVAGPDPTPLPTSFRIIDEAASRSVPSIEGIPHPAIHRHGAA